MKHDCDLEKLTALLRRNNKPKFKPRGSFRTLSNIYMELFVKIVNDLWDFLRLQAVNYFRLWTLFRWIQIAYIIVEDYAQGSCSRIWIETMHDQENRLKQK